MTDLVKLTPIIFALFTDFFTVNVLSIYIWRRTRVLPNLAFHSIPILFTSPCDFLLFIWMAEMRSTGKSHGDFL